MFRAIYIVFLVFVVCGKGDSVKDILRRQVVAAWCEELPEGIGFSLGEYFSCLGNNTTANGSDVKGLTLKIGVIEGSDLGYDCSSTMHNGQVQPKDSYSLYLLSILKEVLQFNVTYMSSTSWGYHEEPNGTWKGLSGLVVSNTVDMVACHWAGTQYLSRVADYLLSTLETTESFIYLPQNLPLTEDVFVAAFSRKLWIFFLLSIFLLIISFRFSTYMHSKVRPDHEPWSWDEVVLWAVAAIAQQSYSRHPRGSSCRTMFLNGYLIAYLFYTGFAAGITSLLALQGHLNQLTLNKVADMKLHLILHRDEHFPDFFEKSGFAYLNIHQGNGESLQNIFLKIKQTNFLGFGSTVTLLHYLRENVEPGKRGNYLVVPASNYVRQKSFLVKKSFPYKHLFNYWLLRLREHGLLDLGKKRYLKSEEAANFHVAKWFSADLGNVFSAAVFLFSGWVLSIVVLCLEILWEKKFEKETCNYGKVSRA